MPRIRSVKPEMWDDRKLARSVSRDGRLLYIGLWNHADEHARVQGDPRFVKGRVFPYEDDLDEEAVDDLLDELATAGRIVRYTVDGDPYLFLPKLDKHQRLEAAKVPSRLPSPADADPAQIRADESARGESDIGGAQDPPAGDTEGTSSEGEQDPHAPDTPSEDPSGEREGTPDPAARAPQVNAPTQEDPDEFARDADESERNVALAGGREQVAGSREQGGAGGGAPEPDPGPHADPDPAKKARRGSGTRLPDDFAVTDEMAAWAREKAPSCGSEDHAAFCDYWRAKPGKDGRKTDWIATWRNWMRREHERRASRGQPRTPGSTPRETVFDRARQRLNAATPGGAP
ncbi:hypothetical protein Q7689_00555 [Nocardiopsis tropica]|uniref:hypothetical protein n=1 Tax=Nocardiopsis tropica TaxID=109330 RepID=UPI002E87519C|nr:hypothetical protein [Nocardiopsis tropica]